MDKKEKITNAYAFFGVVICIRSNIQFDDLFTRIFHDTFNQLNEKQLIKHCENLISFYVGAMYPYCFSYGDNKSLYLRFAYHEILLHSKIMKDDKVTYV